MASFWDLLPASLWPVQPFVWPRDSMQPSPRPQETAPLHASAPTALTFGWAPARAAAASAPAFGWAAAPPAPANAPVYSGATDPDAFLGSFPDAETLDPARSARLLEDAKRAHDFALWAFGPPSIRPAQQTRYAAAATGAPRPSAPPVDIDDTTAVPPPTVTTESMPAPPTNWGDRWKAQVGNPNAGSSLESAAQAPGLGATTGNPNIERQGARARAAASAWGINSAGEPLYPNRVAKRVGENFRNAFEASLGPGAEYREAVRPFIVSPSGRINVFNRAALIEVPELADAATRGLRALYDSAIDAGTEGLESAGVSRSTTESLGRDLKAIPEAFAGSPGIARRMVPPPPLILTGQIHHGISLPVFRGLERHGNLRGVYRHRDPRFETQAVDLPAHNGWWGWHKNFDEEVASYIDEHPKLTPETFESWATLALRSAGSEGTLSERIPKEIVRCSSMSSIADTPRIATPEPISSMPTR